MAIPDITSLTEEELTTLLQQANALLIALRNQEEETRNNLLDPEVVAQQIENLLTQGEAVQGVIDTPNGEVKANPQLHILALARAQKRTINNLIRVLRTSAGVLDSADTGEDPVEPPA